MFNNFLNTVKTAATSVAQTVEEQNRQNQGNRQGNNQEDVEETVGKVDSQGGKVQVTTVQVDTKKEDSKGSDFLSGLVSVAQVVGKTLNEHNKQAEEQKNTEETIGKVDSQGGKVQVTTVHDDGKKKEEAAAADKPDFLAGLVNVAQDIGKVVGKSFEEQQKNQNQNQNTQHHVDVEETVGKVDSQGGKVQLTSVQDSEKKEEEKSSSNFLSGLINVAQDIGKAVEKSRNEQQPAPPAEPQQNPSGSAPKFNDSDLKALGENIGSIVGGIFKKDAAEGKKPETTEFKAEVVIDDVEGEIGKVTTSGYTATHKPS